MSVNFLFILQLRLIPAFTLRLKTVIKNVREHQLKNHTSSPPPNLLISGNSWVWLVGGSQHPHKPCVALTESPYANKGGFPWLKQSSVQSHGRFEHSSDLFGGRKAPVCSRHWCGGLYRRCSFILYETTVWSPVSIPVSLSVTINEEQSKFLSS